MNFENINLKTSYRTSDDNIIEDFLVPSLRETVIYKRAAGFFSSTALIELSRGISGLIENNGKMYLIVSPKLSEEDIKAIKEGYKEKTEIIENSLMKGLKENLNIETEKNRLNLMIDLIAKGILDIKIAVLDNPNNDDFGMYHEKIGIMIDGNDNKIAFNGSYNESLNSYVNNFESLDVYSTLKGEFERVEEKNWYFDKMWNNTTNKLQVIEMPEAIKREMLEVIYDKSSVLSEKEIIKKENKLKIDVKPNFKMDMLRKYQEDAILCWKSKGYRGIFDMATGTGKTFTAIGAATQLYNDLNGNLAVVIICPYTHLVEQWAEDLIKFGFNPIIGYGESNDKHWKDKLSSKTLLFKLNSNNDKFFTFITTNASFKKPFIQEKLKNIENKNILFIADEAHNLGAGDLMLKLNPNFKYRIALSATFDRYNDEEGTEFITNYFRPLNDPDPYCIHYSLKQAIEDGKLTEYNYHPILTYLNEEELYDYLSLTNELRKHMKVDNKGKVILSDSAKFILLKRARLVAGSTDKLHKLIDLVKLQNETEKEITNTLIYCGATTINDPTYNEFNIDDEDNKQIDIVKDMIKKEFSKLNKDINIARFTSLEDNKMRKLIKEQFCNRQINIITAIKCLDEGVNIPAIKTAYILASSTNPREYVQRRGRVLRKFEGKNYAEIYDFITLPRPLQDAYSFQEESLISDLGLVKREMTRIKDFAETASNYAEIYGIIEEINNVYGELLSSNKCMEENINYE